MAASTSFSWAWTAPSLAEEMLRFFSFFSLLSMYESISERSFVTCVLRAVCFPHESFHGPELVVSAVGESKMSGSCFLLVASAVGESKMAIQDSSCLLVVRCFHFSVVGCSTLK
uniref:Uncharacterized protein n=1 Tax=Ixodes ricinus TaxID=34613 RepID=A0A147BB90_IXORI